MKVRYLGVDFEYRQAPGEMPRPHCVVWRNFSSGRVGELFIDTGGPTPPCPSELTGDVVLVAHNLSAEAACFDALGWPFPRHGLCTMAEFRRMTNGTNRRANLMSACGQLGIPFMESSRKDEMRDLAIRGGPFRSNERRDLLEYCREDVLVLEPLLNQLGPLGEGWNIRGKFMLEAGRIRNRGVPVDKEGLLRWEEEKDRLRSEMADEVNKRYRYPLFDKGSFKQKAFAEFVRLRGIDWPRLESGKLDRKDETFKFMSSKHPQLRFLRETNKTLRQATCNGFSMGSDGRHRFDCIHFATSTGRSQPKNCLFLGPSWMRGFVQAPPDKVFVIADFKSQEILIAAACAGDDSMIADYDSGDFYLGLAKRMGAVRQNAQRGDSPEVDSARDLYKQLALAIQYGMGAKSLAERLGQSERKAKGMLGNLRRAYPRFWRWRERVGNVVAMNRPLHAALGWQLLPPYSSKSSLEQGKSSTLSSLNFPVQGTGSEILRATVIRLAAEGFEICATLHDSVMVELDLEDWQARLRHLEFVMTESTRPLLGGYGVTVESKVLMPGERYLEDKGRGTWEFMSEKLDLDR